MRYYNDKKGGDNDINKFLEDLGYKSTNDRLYIGIFKALGLIEDSGQPTTRYYEFIDQTQTGQILAQGIEEAYEDLFNLNKKAQDMTNEEIKNKLKTLTQGQKTDKVLTYMANTFKALCAQADWNKKSKNIEQSKIPAYNSPAPEKDNLSPIIDYNKSTNKMNLHYNIQIHLPETTNMAVYDSIFQSLKKHLL